jgi:hypothetical protein
MRIIYCVGLFGIVGRGVEASDAERSVAAGSSDSEALTTEQSDSAVTEGVKSVNEMKFETMKEILGLQDLDTEKIKKYLTQKARPNTMFRDPEIGDLLKYFFNSGVLKDLAVFYSDAIKTDSSVEGGASAAKADAGRETRSPSAKVKSGEDAAVKKAVEVFKDKLKFIIDRLKKSDKPNLVMTRNIDYMIGALSFLQSRPQFRSLTKTDEDGSKQTADSMKIFMHMLDLVLKAGYPEDVGLIYDDFANCFSSYNYKTQSNGFLGFNKNLKEVKYRAGIHGLIPSLMAYEAIAEFKSSGSNSDVYDTFKSEIVAEQAKIKGTCSAAEMTKLETFARAVISDPPATILAFTGNQHMTSWPPS